MSQVYCLLACLAPSVKGSQVGGDVWKSASQEPAEWLQICLTVSALLPQLTTWDPRLSYTFMSLSSSCPDPIAFYLTLSV